MRHCRRPATDRSAPSRRQAVAQLVAGGATVLALGPATACSQPQPSASDDDDDALLAGILSQARPLIPRRQRPYRITRTLPIAGDRTVLIEAGAHILWAGPLNSADQIVAVFEAMGNQCGVAVEGRGQALVESETPSPYVYAAVMRGRQGFSVMGIQALDCQHVYVSSSTQQYAEVRTHGPDSNHAREVTVRGGGARFREPATEGNGACLLAYVETAHIIDARYENVSQGVQWWGGDAGLLAWQNGQRVNERKCSGILIERVSVRLARIGGIWGSMGRDIVVRDCWVDVSLDVAFDAEGSNGVSFERCTARNGHNACFATFFLCDGVRFVDCRGTVDNKAFPLFRTYNVTQNHVDNRNVEVVGGRFECVDPTGPGTMDTASGPVRDLTITGATLVNVRIDTAFSNMHRTRIAENTLTFTRSLGTEAAIRAGSSKGNAANPAGAVVENNRIHYEAGSSPDSSTAIEIRDDDFNSSPASRVIGNRISGPFAIGVKLINATGNAGMLPSYEVIDNRFVDVAPSARLLVVGQEGTQARQPVVRWDPGQTLDGEAVSLQAATGQ